MPNWSESMSQTFEYYTVDPYTWRDRSKLTKVLSSELTRDDSVETLGSASISLTEAIGEQYVRVYLVTNQNGIIEKHPLGTYLVQTPETVFDGKIGTISADAYTPLIELKENPPPIGFYVDKDENIMDRAYALTREHLRAPVVKAVDSTTLVGHFVANTDDTWLTYISDLASSAKYEFAIDEMGRIIFAPYQNTSALMPVYTYNDNNSSILYPSVTINRDLYGIPNVVEVVYSTSNSTYYGVAKNEDEGSIISTHGRGREIIHRISDVTFSGSNIQEQVDDYAKRMLQDLSTLECELTYTHAYCPVRLGDAVRLNYERAGIRNVKAKVKKQVIKCEPGCPVTETAVFTTSLWG